MTLLRVVIFLFLASLPCIALGGTTGRISGTLVDALTNAPIASATVTVSSPSEAAATQTDAGGHFYFVSLAPGTYSITVEKDGYDRSLQSNVAVSADTAHMVTLQLRPTLHTIANVKSQAASDLVKRGTTADVYTVTASTQDKVSALGGGSFLNSAYAAISTVPGAVVGSWAIQGYQHITIRGGQAVGYEFDGVPIQRSFDNAFSGSLPSLGMSEVQVYTGAVPANSEGEALSGYINQVIKTGTFPGYGLLSGALGGPAYYHQLSTEAGGASPNRLFSYYVGIRGYNQANRYVDPFNGAAYSDAFGPAFQPLLPPEGDCSQPDAVNFALCYANGQLAGPGGFQLAPYNYQSQADAADRNIVVNLHLGLPHRRDTGRDDIQILWESERLFADTYSSTNDAGGPGAFTVPGNTLGSPPFYIDGWAWDGPVGQILPASQIPRFVAPYFFPNAPKHPFFGDVLIGKISEPGLIPNNARDTDTNNQEIFKLQYQKNFSSSAYLRLYGYTYYSDDLEYGPQSLYQDFNGAVYPDRVFTSHTRGFSANFSDQLSAQNLLSAQANYTTSTTIGDLNQQFFNALVPAFERFAVLVDPNSPTSGVCYKAAGVPVPVPVTCGGFAATWLTFQRAYAAQQGTAPPLADFSNQTCGTGPCSWYIVENGLRSSYKNVVPKFSAASVTDTYHPNDKLLLNGGLRFDRFEFDGADTRPSDPARQFWFNAWNLDHCVTPNVNAIPKPLQPGQSITTPCESIQSPFGPLTTPKLTNPPNQVLSSVELQPRIAGTYTLSADNVLRFSYGKYARPPASAGVQLNTLQEDLADFVGGNVYDFGFTTPLIPLRPEVSYNADLSWEHRFNATDWSLKLTPYLRKTNDQLQSFLLNDVLHIAHPEALNVAHQTSDGIEFQLNKGDFNNNGVSAQLSFTYTNSYINYDTLQNGSTVLDAVNDTIKTYNAYTSFCASSPSDRRCGSTTTAVPASACYDATGAAVTCSALGAIANPYWNAPVQGLFDPKAAYTPFGLIPSAVGAAGAGIETPYSATLVLNYKRDRFAITPSLQFYAGSRYGGAETMVGIDPASGCAPLAGGTLSTDPRYPYGAAGGAPFDAMTCGNVITVPNSYTHEFDALGGFVEPNLLLMNLQLRYELSPKVSLIGTFANLYWHCWGGSKAAWIVRNPDTCAYSVNSSGGAIPPETNVYNPVLAFTGPQRLVQYPYAAYPGAGMPFNFYVETRITL